MEIDSLELGMQPHREHRHRPAVAIVGGIDEELVVRGGLQRTERKSVIGFYDLFIAGMGQLPIADQDAEALQASLSQSIPPSVSPSEVPRA